MLSDLLKIEPTREHPLAGHCYVTTEALFHMGFGASGFKPKRAKDADGITHWWLEHPETGFIIDETANQYLDFGITPPYADGKFGGFLTKEPSRRAQILMSRRAT